MSTTYNLEHFVPEENLKNKYFVHVLTFTIFIWSVLSPFIAFIMIDEGISDAFKIVFTWTTSIAILILILTYWLTGIYYKSISFEILDNEIHVFRGFITKSRKVVPFRTITNLDTRWGPFDRMFKLGTIEIQTAGFSAGKAGPEEKIDGLKASEVENIQQIILNKVRKIKGSSGIANDVNNEDISENEIIKEILIELKELKKILKNKL